MCLIAFNWQPDSPEPLIIAANRDEDYRRPTLALHRWPDQPIVAGRDLQAQGTWLGVGLTGRVAALTNYRDVLRNRADAPSRGAIIREFLTSSQSCEHHLDALASSCHLYNPFNLLVFDGRSLMGFESRNCRAFKLEVGVGVVSNADFNVPWPKATRLHEGFSHTLKQGRQGGDKSGEDPGNEALFSLLSDEGIAPDDDLPDTGVPLEWERSLSAVFVRTAAYGTRASSVVRVGQSHADFVERSFSAQGFAGQVHQRIDWERGP